MVNIALNGCCGRMGQALSSLIAGKDNCKVIFGIDSVGNTKNYDFPVYKSCDEIPSTAKADVIIDFSHFTAVRSITEYAAKSLTPIVVATTAITPEDKKFMQEISSEIPVFHSANMSIGICLIKELAKKAEIFLGEDFDVEIVERHHNQKLDAPSGTALAIADAINDASGDRFEYIYDRSQRKQKRDKKELGISAVRGGTIIGDHEVIFAGTNEVIEITHRAQSREVFASGALKAAIYIAGKEPGFYNMETLASSLV